jgi:hypothetical protein
MADTRQSIEDLLSGASKTKITGGTTSAQPVSQGGDDGTAEEKLKKKLELMKTSETEAKIQMEAEARKIPYIDLTTFPISGDALLSVPENVSNEQSVVCFLNTGEEIRLATTNPDNQEVKKILESMEESLHVKGAIYLTSERNLKAALEQYAKTESRAQGRVRHQGRVGKIQSHRQRLPPARRGN